jgi:transcription-repair coupling factor (superfamily II helicase)
MQELITALNQKKKAVFHVAGHRGSSAALLVARAAIQTSKAILCIVPSEKKASELEQDLSLFTDIPVYLYPGYDIPPYTPLSPDQETVAARIATLYNSITTPAPFVCIAPVEALLRRVLPKNRITHLTELILRNEETDQEELSKRLVEGGYEHVSLVQTFGEFSIRGSIIDIFSPGFEYPVRLDFFGDTVESIRHFDPITQRSVEELDEVILLPTRDILFPADTENSIPELVRNFREKGDKLNWRRQETSRIVDRLTHKIHFPGIEFFLPLFYPELSAPSDYFTEDNLVFLFEPAALKNTIQLTWERIEANYNEALLNNTPALPPETLFLNEKELQSKISAHTLVNLSDFSDVFSPAETEQKQPDICFIDHTCGDHTLIKQHIELHRKKHGFLQPLAEMITDWFNQGDSVCLGCHSERHAAHVEELFTQHGIQAEIKKPPFNAAHMQKEKIIIYAAPITYGFDLPSEKSHFLSENELFGERQIKSKKRSKDTKALSALRFEELQNGDIVVHKAHGLGIYEGLNNITVNTIPRDFLQITYLGDDKLYVPVDQINLISKYKGISDKKPAIDKLGSKSWAAAKDKVKQAVWKVAQDLLDLYARRKLEKGHTFSKPDELYFELEESFPFDETSGQIQAINDVMHDLTSDQPMDRLVCGDVGYGKTEVAIRAAFKVVADSYQVAILVPTTVLAEQHAATFRERFEGFPVRVESLNRFRSPATQKKILANLAAGSIDIVIGTHRLLSKDIVFKRLGLLIIDEEHRFGVTHKEKLKKLRANVDVLTLTATPIPRTLQMSLLGVRDLTVISSPPEHRRSVKTFIARSDDLVIKEAVTKELQRKGQVFIVHNRVRSIQDIAFKVQKLAPAARIAVAHGQMPVKELEEIMVRFVDRKIDVLVCTTIIESGLDIPNANTIIITRADRLGLAEIYQLRGRVGRSREQAYAYLLVPSLDGLSKDARQRLRALMDYNELGGGFKLAMSDLQIRGGGNILGGSQSGHIAAVGYDLYLDLLQKTVTDLKQKGSALVSEIEEIEPEINLHISAYIPEKYIRDSDQRYIAYRKISVLSAEEELQDMKDELSDRYGKLTPEVINLFDIIALKMELKKIRIVKLEQGKNNLAFSFDEQTPVSPAKILQLVEASKNKIRFTPEAKLIIPSDNLSTPAAILAASRKVLHAIM